MSFIPFSTYDLGVRPPQALCIIYSAPTRKNGQPQRIVPLPPRDCELIAHVIAMPDEVLQLYSEERPDASVILSKAPPRGRFVPTRLEPRACKLRAHLN
jgi:hypothetical protein